ncbi:microtubule-associated protein 4 isoform X2 [Poecile atricapillus]|uniref:microtubule-associated protein 4 isoform X2 n=1 Tax=Poecile atricapillus TaxID=48891 RepID=UPI0027386976|nr:microtubule-associated protein 4 isoform X2 [Poecile atricapillus]
MADLDHNLSLADALTEPPHDVEDEVKRDFIATLEAEKFDDVVGETVDKTDYVPLLDDEDDAKPGSQEPKSKSHVDGIPVEHSSASGPMVVENGDHGLQGHGTVFPGEIMDEKMSYKEFLDRNDSWSAEERELCFKPMDMAEPFSLHRGENLPDLSFPTDMRNVPLFPGHADAARDILAPHGSMMGPEQPFLGSLYSPAEALDPSAFIGLESGTEFLPGKAAPEEYWMGAQQDMKGPDTSFFVEPPVPPSATEAIRTSLPESPTAAAAPGNVPAAASAFPGEAAATDGPKGSTPGAASVPAADAASLPAEKAGAVPAADTKPPPAPGAAAPAAAANPFQATDLGFSPAPEANPPKGVNDISTPAADAGSHHGLELGFAPAAGVESHHAMDLGFAPAAGMEPHQATDLGFAPAAGVESHQTMDLGFAPAAGVEPHHAMDLGFAPAADVEPHHAMDLGFAPSADVEPHHDMDLGFAPAADVEPHHAMDFAPAADVEPHHAMDFAPAADIKAQHTVGPELGLAADAEFAPAAEANHQHSLDSGFAPAAPAKPVPAVDTENVSVEAQPGPAGAAEAALQQDKSPAEAPAKVEAEPKVPEVCVDQSEKMKDRKPPPSPLDEHLPGKSSHQPEAAAEAKGALENKDLPEKSAPAEDGEARKEEAEHNHVQHAEPQEGKTLQEPTGLPTAQVRQAPKSRDRGFGRAKPAPVPLTDVPEEHPVGLPQQKSPEPRADPCSTVELGCGAGTSPRFRVPHKKATSVPKEPVESCRDPSQESWDLEGAVVKKKKKKPKQRRNQLPRGMELWEENGAGSRAARNAPFGLEWQNPEPEGTSSGSRALDVPKDAKITTGSHILDEQNAFPVPAPGQQPPKSALLDARARQEAKTEGRRGDSWILECKGKSREVPSEQRGKTEVEESAPVSGPSEPTERDFPGKSERREHKESRGADLTVHESKAGTPLQTKPLELPLSHKNKEPKTSSPGQEAPSGSVHQLSLETAAKKNREKSNGVGKEHLKQPHLEDKLPAEPKAAGGSETGSEGGLKTPRDAPGAPVPASLSAKLGEVPAVQGRRAEGVPDAPKHPSPGGAGGWGGADSPDPNPGKGSPAPEQRAGKDPSSTHGVDRPKKKRSEGKGKRIKSFSEQMVLAEDGGKFTEGGRTGEDGKEAVYPENGQGVPARGHPAASATDKPKKRGSDGRSKKGERSFFQQPFLESKMDAGSFPEVAGKVREGSDEGRAGGSVPAGGLQENAAKTQRSIELRPEKPKENVGKPGTADLRALDQTLLLEKSKEEAKIPALAATTSLTEEVDLVGKGREAGGGAGLAEKGRKRSSDGRRKEAEHSPWGQAAVPGAGGDSSQQQEPGNRKETSLEKEKGSGLQRERLAEELGKPKIQSGSGSFSELPNLSGQKPEISEAEIGSVKETWPMNRGKEAEKSHPLPEHRAGMHSPSRELGMDKAKSKSRDGKGKKAEHRPELQPGNVPAVGHSQQTQAEKGKENSRTPAGHLPDPAKVETPALPLEPGKSHPGDEEEHRKGEPEPQQPFLLEHKAGAGMFPPPGLEIRDKPEAGGASPCSRNKNSVPEHPAVSDPSLAPVTERSKKRGYDGSSKKAKNASRHVPLEANPERSEAQPPLGSGLGCGMEDTDFVDENRNIKNFPTGPQRLWNNKRSDLKSVAQSTASGAGGDAPCDLPKQREGAAGAGGLPPPPPLPLEAENSSKEPGAGAEKEMQRCHEQPLSLGHKEPAQDVSQRGGKSREAEVSHRGQPKDKSDLSPEAKVDDKETKPSDEKPSSARAPSEEGAAVGGTGGAETPRAERGTGSLPPAPAGTPPSTGISSPSAETPPSTGIISPAPAETPPSTGIISPPAETPPSTGIISPSAETPPSTGIISPSPPAMSQAVPGAGMDRKAGGDTRSEQSSPQHRGTEPQGAGPRGTSAQTTQKQPKESRKGPWQPAEEGPAPAAEALMKDAPRGGELLLKDTLVPESELEKPQDKTKEKDSRDTNKETQDTAKEKESQDTTKEKKPQELTKEKKSQDITKEKEPQEVTKEKESQDTTREKKPQELTKEKESQEITKEKESQGITKEKESQGITKEKESQGITKEKEPQDITKEKESQGITKEKECQDITKEKEPQDITKEKEPQDITKEKEPQEITKEKESQGITKEKEPQDITKEKESQGITKEKESQAPSKETEECEQKAVKEAKKERLKAAEQLKGYMRPTKARGVPALVARPALARAGPRQARQDRAKPEEPKAAEAVSGNDITAPPNKELPPSPEKKTKPAASSSAPKPAAAKAKPSATTSPKRPSSATPGTNKKPTSPTAGPTPGSSSKRPGTSSTRPSTLTPKETKPKVADAKPAEKRTSLSKPPSSTTPKTPSRSSSAAPRTTAPSPVTAAAAAKTTAATPPKRPTSIKTDAKPADAKKTPAKSPSDSSRPKSAPGSAGATKSSATTPSTTASSAPGAASGRPKPKSAAPKAAAASTVSADAKKTTAKASVKVSAPKAARPASSASAPDLKNVRSKIGSTDNIKHQPGGGKGKIEKRPEPAAAAPRSEPSTGTKVAPKAASAKEGVPKQPNGKVQIVSKKANYSHVQSKCGSKDNIKHVPGGGNVQIQNKKVDLSKVSSKCGSKANIKHKPGGGDVKIENQKLNFKEKAQAKVGSLDNVGHSPAGGALKVEGGAEPNGAGPGPGVLPQNGVGPGPSDQREPQSLDSRIQETSI